jgi:hypothetical protein
MFNFLKKKVHTPKERGVYAFTQYRRGEFILFIEKTNDDVYVFMHLPDRYNLSFTLEEFSKGLNSGLFDFVEQIPLDVFEVSKANMHNFEKIS